MNENTKVCADNLGANESKGLNTKEELKIRDWEKSPAELPTPLIFIQLRSFINGESAKSNDSARRGPSLRVMATFWDKRPREPF
jgi:hypothetical protein